MMEHESFNVIVEELILPVEADLASDDRWTSGFWKTCGSGNTCPAPAR
jgi:hypothetical protein